MRLISGHELVYVTATLTHRGQTVEIPDVLVDTGAASTVINADLAANAGIYLEATDQLRRLRGVGGHEHVFLRKLEWFAVGERGLDAFDVEVGEMDYGFEIGAILGMDFLQAVRAIIDLGNLTISFG